MVFFKQQSSRQQTSQQQNAYPANQVSESQSLVETRPLYQPFKPPIVLHPVTTQSTSNPYHSTHQHHSNNLVHRHVSFDENDIFGDFEDSPCFGRGDSSQTYNCQPIVNHGYNNKWQEIDDEYQYNNQYNNRSTFSGDAFQPNIPFSISNSQDRRNYNNYEIIDEAVYYNDEYRKGLDDCENYAEHTYKNPAINTAFSNDHQRSNCDKLPNYSRPYQNTNCNAQSSKSSALVPVTSLGNIDIYHCIIIFSKKVPSIIHIHTFQPCTVGMLPYTFIIKRQLGRE